MLHYKTVEYSQFDRWVVMIHGAGGSIEVWFRQVADYARYISIPTLYLMGEDDKLFLPQVQQTVKNGGDNMSLIVVPNAGHVCNIDNKRFFNLHSLEFMQSIAT